MALQVWLPLTGSLENKGLSETTITSNGTVTVENAGKIGSCYYFNGGNLVLPPTTMTSFSECTVAFWLKINSWKTNWDTFFQAGLGSTPWNNYIFGVLRNQSSHVVFTVSNGSSTSSGSYKSSALTLGEWTHLAFTYSDGKCKIYLNGMLDYEYTTSIIPNFSGITKITIGRCNNESGYPTDSCINDVRIYDEALDSLEIKRLSQGLILHYPLNNNGLGGENLALNTYNLNIASTKTNKYSYIRGSSTRVLRSDGFTEVKCTASWQGLSIWANQFNFADGDYITYSFYIYTNGSTRAFSFYPMMFNSAGTRDTSTGLPISIDGGNYTTANAKAFTSTATLTPERHYVTFKWNSDVKSIIDNGGSIELSIQLHGTWNDGDWSCVYAPKLEYGSIATPYTPSPYDFDDSNIVYDCSGYDNNGTVIGTLTAMGDTPKYLSSTYFNTNTSKIKLPVLSFTGMADSYTFAWWQYNTSTGNMPWGFSNGNRLNCYHCSPICWNTGDGSSNQFKNGSTTVAPTSVQNAWHYMVVTGDGTSVKLYIDGVYKGTAVTYKSLTGTQIYISGWDTGTYYTFVGSKLSDFRIYATALSADDVKALYEDSAYIASDGTAYTYEYVEV